MKKLTAFALLAVFAATTQAKQVNTPIGVVETEFLAVTAAGTFVLVNLAGNASGTTLPTPPPGWILVCNRGGNLSSDGVCYKEEGQKVVVVGTGTGTATTTITVPIVSTYAATLTQQP